MTEGTANSCDVYLRRIVGLAASYDATQAILAHNHPSGNDRPSSHDITLTKKVQEAGRVLDITLLDHIVVCPNRYYSFADNGML